MQLIIYLIGVHFFFELELINNIHNNMEIKQRV